MFYQKRNSVYKIWLLLFFAGFLAGILIMNICGISLLGEDGIFNEASINRLKYMEVNKRELFVFVVPRRLKQYFAMGILSTTFLGIWILYGNVIMQGMLAGMMITAAFIRFGVKGLLLLFSVMFPQQLLFVPAMFMMLCWCYQNCSMLYYPAKCIWPCGRGKKKQYLCQGVILFWIVGVVCIGCILASYVNPILITDIMKIF